MVYLTPRQQEILEIFSMGVLCSEIAEEFEISTSTVHNYLDKARIYNLCRNRVELVARYYKENYRGSGTDEADSGALAPSASGS